MSVSRACVVIVVYAATISKLEEASLEQCVKVLKNHDIALVCPESLNIDQYLSAFDRYEKLPRVQKFSDDWFESIRTYNSLMLQEFFYHRFSAYEYILIYQLDAWVFRDELEYWCNKKLVYVGAPWFTDRGEVYPFYGNGGFSLRHIRSFIDLLGGSYQFQSTNWKFLWPQLNGKNRFNRFAKKVIHAGEMLCCRLSPQSYCTLNFWDYEDFVFAKTFALLDSERTASFDDAAHFSFERFPEILYSVTKSSLPFGCHAFAKEGRYFWETWIEALRD
jgi:hypothetical protein